MNIIIRKANISDVSTINKLSDQLGYAISESETRTYLELILAKENEVVFVAELENLVIGWIGVFKTLHLVSGYGCEVAGLVIDENHHRKGLGKQLIEKANEWTKEQNCDHLRVRTNTKRKDAHKFYESLGFTEIKEQKVYEKWSEP